MLICGAVSEVKDGTLIVSAFTGRTARCFILDCFETMKRDSSIKKVIFRDCRDSYYDIEIKFCRDSSFDEVYQEWEELFFGIHNDV